MAIQFVASVSNPSPGTSSEIDTTGATLLIAVYTQTGAVVPSISDSLGNQWHVFTLEDGASTALLRIAFAQNVIVGAGHTFTNTGGFSSLCVAAFSGVSGAAFLDVSNDGTTDTIQAGSITPPVNDSLVIAGLSYRQTSAVSIDSGFTIAEQRPFITSVAVGSALAYLIQTTATAVNPQWSWTGNSQSGATNVAFVPVSSGGGGGARSFWYVG